MQRCILRGTRTATALLLLAMLVHGDFQEAGEAESLGDVVGDATDVHAYMDSPMAGDGERKK